MQLSLSFPPPNGPPLEPGADAPQERPQALARPAEKVEWSSEYFAQKRCVPRSTGKWRSLPVEMPPPQSRGPGNNLAGRLDRNMTSQGRPRDARRHIDLRLSTKLGEISSDFLWLVVCE